jgi:hypothetical protein
MNMAEVGRRESQSANASQPKPPDLTIWSLITTCVFFNGFGLAAFYLTVKSQERWREGQWAEAKRFALISRILNIVALVLWSLIMTAVFIGVTYFLVKIRG